MWTKLVARALKDTVIDRRFTFHDLRACHVTQFKKQTGALPDLHANPATTARGLRPLKNSQKSVSLTLNIPTVGISDYMNIQYATQTRAPAQRLARI